MPFSIRQASLAQLCNGCGVPNGGEHMLQRHPLGHVVMDVACRHQRQMRLTGKLDQLIEAGLVVGAVVKLSEQVAALAKNVAIAVEVLDVADRLFLLGSDRSQQPLAVPGDVVQC